MIPASYRVGWAARGSLNKAPWALAGVGTAAGFAGVLTGSGTAGPRLAMASAGLAVVSMIVVDFPAPSHRSWSEFELSLPLGVRDLARARLVLAAAVWLVPVLLAFGLGATGLLPAPAGPVAAIAALSAMGSVMLAAVAREVLGLSGWSRHASMVGRVAVLLVAAIGFVAPAAWLAPALVLAAYAWWRSALASAPAAFELELGRAGAAGSSESQREGTRPSTTGAVRARAAGPLDHQRDRSAFGPMGGPVSALLRRHTLGNMRAATFLAGTCLWAFSAEGLDLSPGAWVFVLQWPAFYALLSSRVLRLEPLPLDRDRLFRYVAWPPLIAFAVGSILAIATASSLPLAQVQGCCGEITVQSAKRHWRFASGEVPLVTGRDAETYRPDGHRLALGSSLLAYDPYEAGVQSSRAFQVEQLRRLLREQYQVTLPAEEVDARTATERGSGPERIRSTAFPELRGPLQREAAARFILLGLGILLALFTVIHPGPAPLAPRRPGQRRALRPSAWALGLVFLLPLFAIWSSTLAADPASMVGHFVVASVADHLTAALPLAVALAVVLYRTLQRRFRRMEAPLRAESMDDGFIEV